MSRKSKSPPLPTPEPIKLFADTTIAYYCLHSPSVLREATVAAIGKNTVYISPFIRGEYVRGYIIGLIDLFAAIREEGSVDDGFQIFAQDMGHRPRKIQNALSAVPSFLSGFDNSENVDKTLRRLGEFIRTRLICFDARFINRVNDPLACDHGYHKFRQEAYHHDHILDFCYDVKKTKQNPKCNQCGFKSSQLEQLANAGIDLSGPNTAAKFKDKKGFLKQVTAINDATKSTLKKPSCYYCDRLGDTIISLSTPQDQTILTGDHQTFPVFGQLLSKNVQLIPTLSQLRKPKQVKLNESDIPL